MVIKCIHSLILKTYNNKIFCFIGGIEALDMSWRASLLLAVCDLLSLVSSSSDMTREGDLVYRTSVKI